MRYVDRSIPKYMNTWIDGHLPHHYYRPHDHQAPVGVAWFATAETVCIVCFTIGSYHTFTHDAPYLTYSTPSYHHPTVKSFDVTCSHHDYQHDPIPLPPCQLTTPRLHDATIPQLHRQTTSSASFPCGRCAPPWCPLRLSWTWLAYPSRLEPFISKTPPQR